MLGERIRTHDGAYELVVGPGESDLERFTALVAQGRDRRAARDLAGAGASFEEALRLWRGRSGDDLGTDAPLRRRLQALDDEHLLVVEDNLQVRLDLGAGEELVAVFRSLLSDHPTRERLWALLMTALYRCGDISGALDAYLRAATALDELLGMAPGTELRALQHGILERDPDLDPATPAAAVSAADAPRQLPMDNRVLLGRDDELAAVLELCGCTDRPQTRPVVVALDGQGGIGKSALALRAAHRLAEAHPDGQLYVDLQGATAGLDPVDPAQALTAFLRALDVPTSPAMSAQELTARFRTTTADRRLLLLLDDAVDAQQVAPLLPAGPSCTVLVTSRRRLATLDAGLHLSLGTLDHADATAVLATFGGIEPDDEAGARVAALCGGLPLALRLAAARLASPADWSAAELAERLADDHRRLDELGADHVSVRATFAASYDAVVRGDQADDGRSAELFALMGVLRVPSFGYGVVAALADLTGAELDHALRRLSDLHLVETRDGRFVLHDLIRLFAAEQAGQNIDDADRLAALRRAYSYDSQASQLARRQLRPFRTEAVAELEPARRAAPPVCRTVEQARAWFDAERDALLAAVRAAGAAPAELGGIAGPIVVSVGMDLEGDGRLAEAIEVNDLLARIARERGDAGTEARALKALATLYQRCGDRDRARDHIERSIALYDVAGDDVGLSLALNALGIFHTEAERYAEAETLFRRALALLERAGDETGTGVVLNSIGMNLRWRGDHAAAREYLLSSLAVRRRIGDRVGEIYTLMQLGNAYAGAGLLDDALDCFDEVVRLAVRAGVRDLERQGLMYRLQVLTRLGRRGEASADLDAALELCRRTENESARVQVLAAAAAPDRDPERDPAPATP